MTGLILVHWEFYIYSYVPYSDVFQTPDYAPWKKLGYKMSAVGHGRHVFKDEVGQKRKIKEIFRMYMVNINLFHKIMVHSHKSLKATAFKQ